MFAKKHSENIKTMRQTFKSSLPLTDLISTCTRVCEKKWFHYVQQLRLINLLYYIYNIILHEFLDVFGETISSKMKLSRT